MRIAGAHEGGLDQLRGAVLRLGLLVEQQVLECVEALVQRNADQAHHVSARERAVDQLDAEIDAHCMTLLDAAKVPHARLIVSALKIARHLVQVGTLSTGIARSALELAPERLPRVAVSAMPLMAGLAADMLNRSVGAWRCGDGGPLGSVLTSDVLLVGLYRQTVNELVALMERDRTVVSRATGLACAATSLGHVGDHATHIATIVSEFARHRASDRARLGRTGSRRHAP